MMSNVIRLIINKFKTFGINPFIYAPEKNYMKGKKKWTLKQLTDFVKFCKKQWWRIKNEKFFKRTSVI